MLYNFSEISFFRAKLNFLTQVSIKKKPTAMYTAGTTLELPSAFSNKAQYLSTDMF